MGYILAGFIFIFFDADTLSYNLLPDTIGYLLTAYGLSAIAHKSPHFIQARKVSVLLALVTFILDISLFLFYSQGLSMLVIGLFIFFRLYMFFCIIKGVAELEDTMGVYLNSQKLMKWWKFSAVFQAIYFVSMLLTFALGFLVFFIPMLLAAAINFIFCIIFLISFNKTRTLYNGSSYL